MQTGCFPLTGCRWEHGPRPLDLYLCTHTCACAQRRGLGMCPHAHAHTRTRTRTHTHTLGGRETQLPASMFEPLPGSYPLWVAGPHALQGEGSPFLRMSGPLCGPGPWAPSAPYWPGCVVSNSKLKEDGWAAPGKPRPLPREVRRGPVGLLEWNCPLTRAWAGRRGNPGPRAPASTLLLRFPTGEHRSSWLGDGGF